MPRAALKYLPVDPPATVAVSPFAGGTLPVAAAVAEFGIPERALWRLVADGRVRASRPGTKCALLSRSDIIAVLDAAEVRR